MIQRIAFKNSKTFPPRLPSTWAATPAKLARSPAKVRGGLFEASFFAASQYDAHSARIVWVMMFGTAFGSVGTVPELGERAHEGRN